ncbi:hypothetical protein E5676_scaffold78784G00010 [Cucumis melo var. makuwa]|nr:hypothetical protein E5676_scaffold78784G00010 [Cucumis melo var. makuwa]
MQPRAKEPTSDERAGPRRPGAKLTPYRGAPSSDPRSPRAVRVCERSTERRAPTDSAGTRTDTATSSGARDAYRRVSQRSDSDLGRVPTSSSVR